MISVTSRLEVIAIEIYFYYETALSGAFAYSEVIKLLLHLLIFYIQL